MTRRLVDATDALAYGLARLNELDYEPVTPARAKKDDALQALLVRFLLACGHSGARTLRGFMSERQHPAHIRSLLAMEDDELSVAAMHMAVGWYRRRYGIGEPSATPADHTV